MGAERGKRWRFPPEQEEIDEYIATMRDDGERTELIERIQEAGFGHRKGDGLKETP